MGPLRDRNRTFPEGSLKGRRSPIFQLGSLKVNRRSPLQLRRREAGEGRRNLFPSYLEEILGRGLEVLSGEVVVGGDQLVLVESQLVRSPSSDGGGGGHNQQGPLPISRSRYQSYLQLGKRGGSWLTQQHRKLSGRGLSSTISPTQRSSSFSLVGRRTTRGRPSLERSDTSRIGGRMGRSISHISGTLSLGSLR